VKAPSQAQLHPDFNAALNAYLARLAKPDPFEDRIDRRLAPATIKARRQVLLAAASALVAQGIPADAIRSLGDLLRPDQYRNILTAIYERVGNGEKRTDGAKTMVAHLKTGRLAPSTTGGAPPTLRRPPG
jgi:hypothetical protein